MSRTNVSSEGKNPSASQDKSGATTADPMSELLTIMLKKSEEANKKFEELGNKLDDRVKEMRKTNQRRAGLQHQDQQPRLAEKADVLEDKKTRENREDFTQDGRLGDISSDRVHAPMRLSSFGYQYSIEPPALPCRDDALVNQGHEVAKVDLDGESDPDVTEIGHVLLAIRKTNFPLQLLPWSFREMSEDTNIGTTTRQTFAKYNRSWHPKAIKTKSRQNMVFDPGGLSGCLCGCPFWEGDARCIVGGVD